jgi:hypothetical protein
MAVRVWERIKTRGSESKENRDPVMKLMKKKRIRKVLNKVQNKNSASARGKEERREAG